MSPSTLLAYPSANHWKSGKHNLMVMVVLAAIYLFTGKLGLSLGYASPSASAIWPPAGISLGAMLIFGYEVWPGILVGALLVNLLAPASLLAGMGIAAGRTIEVVVAAWLVNRYAGGAKAVYSARGIFLFTFFAGLLSPMIAATFGIASLALGQHIHSASFTSVWTPVGATAWASVWSIWWLSNGVSNVLKAPLVLLWWAQPRVRWRGRQWIEVGTLLFSLILVGSFVFDDFFHIASRNYPLEYLCFPFVIWVAYRFTPREAATAALVLAGTAIWGTLHGFGPFARQSAIESLLLLQTFVGFISVMTMGFATAFAERRSAELRNRILAVSDPLTGLGNYRKLIDTLEMEIKRASRTNRPFALLLFDLDGLKKINDAHGHLVGSRALCRLADVLRLHSRSMDTATRYGGDEFVLILPEAGAAAAQHTAERIVALTGSDGKQPPLSVSVGGAVFPADGDTAEKLLNAADLTLYQNKRAKSEPSRALPHTAARSQILQ